MALDICVSATDDVYDRTGEEMRAKLRSIRQACEGVVRYAVRADGFQIAHDVDYDLAKIREWNEAATVCPTSTCRATTTPSTGAVM